MRIQLGYSRPKPSLEIEFRISLIESLLHAIVLVMIGPLHEGLDQWVYATYAALPSNLKADMEICFAFLQIASPFYAWAIELPADDPSRRDFSAFVANVKAFTDKDFQNFLQSGLEAQLEHKIRKIEGHSFPSLQDTEKLRSLLQKEEIVPYEEYVDLAVDLICDPAGLKDRFVAGITRFWDEFYQVEYERNLPLTEQSVEYQRRQNYSGDFLTIFTAVTGRSLPEELYEDLGRLQDLEKVIFIPSCYVGPFVTSYELSELYPLALLFYNCRSRGTLIREELPLVESLFPPLKALADETRLQILTILNSRELYAQQIVERMDISQPAVSRHLQLMVAGGILDVRKEESMKYYSISEKTLNKLANELEYFCEKLGKK